MLPPRAVADNVGDAQWSPSGKYLLYHQTRPITGPEIVSALEGKKTISAYEKPGIWSAATKKSVSYPEFMVYAGYQSGYSWIQKHDVAIRLEIASNPQSNIKTGRIHWVAPATGLAKAFNIGTEFVNCQLVETNPSKPQVVLQLQVVSGRSIAPVPIGAEDIWVYSIVILMDINGNVRKLALPNSEAFLRFTVDGLNLTATYSRYEPALKKSTRVFYELNQSTSKFELANEDNFVFQNEIERPEPILNARLADGIKNPNQLEVKLSAVLLGSTTEEPKRALIAAEASWVGLSPDEKQVAYITKGVLQVREIVPIDLVAFNKAKEVAEKAKAISDAKQSALALLMFAADHDDTYPSNAAGWQDKVNPYSRNRDSVANFVYTFGGGHLKEIEYISDQEIGYVEGPGGRAVAYGDGHVKWIPNGSVPVFLQERKGM